MSADVTLLGSDVQVEAEYVPSPLVLETHCWTLNSLNHPYRVTDIEVADLSANKTLYPKVHELHVLHTVIGSNQEHRSHWRQQRSLQISTHLHVENTLATSVQLDKGIPHTNLRLRLGAYTVLTSVSWLLTPLLPLAVYVLLVPRSLMPRPHPCEERVWWYLADWFLRFRTSWRFFHVALYTDCVFCNVIGGGKFLSRK